MKSELNWLNQIHSPNPQVKILAMEPILKNIKGRLEGYLMSSLGNRKLAEDFAQEISISACKAAAKGNLKKVTNPSDVEKFIFVSARNRLIDYFRREDKAPVRIPYEGYHIAKDSYPDKWNIEHKLEGDWERSRMLNLCQYLTNEDAQLSMLLLLNGFSYRQVSWLVPWSESTVRRHFSDSILYLVDWYQQDPEYVLPPVKHDKSISFIDDDGFLGITFANADPQHLSGETAKELCQRLGLQNIDQLRDYYNPYLVILKAFTDYSTVRLSFLLRSDEKLGDSNGAPLIYLDSTPTFAPDNLPGKGRKKEKLWLDDLREFKAWVVDSKKTEQNNIEIFDWIYAIPGGWLYLRKVLTKEALSNTNLRKPSMHQFKARMVSGI